MPIQNTDTQTSPGIGLLPDGVGFAPMGGCIVDVVGLNGRRLTAQIATSRMFYGWTSPLGPNATTVYLPNIWLRICTESFDATGLDTLLGGGVAKANIRITLYDGDSGSPNPVYVAMFGAGHFPYVRWTIQPPNFDFDGGQILWLGFEDANGTPVSCGYMGEVTTYHLSPTTYGTLHTFTGFPGVYALNDFTNYPTAPRPAEYLPAFPVTGWFNVPDSALSALYARLLTGSIVIGVHDLSPGDQFYDFMAGLAADVVNIPFIPITPGPEPLPPPIISCGNPPAGFVGVPYSHRIPYQISTSFYTIAITSGGLPAGLSMSSMGVITGSPILPGSYSFTVTVTDSTEQTADVTCSITVTQPSASGYSNVAF